MLADIEDLVSKELFGLCGSCAHQQGCVYRKNSTRTIIQCEVFESATIASRELADENKQVKGLCLNCNKNRICHLPREASGVWQCEEYE